MGLPIPIKWVFDALMLYFKMLLQNVRLYDLLNRLLTIHLKMTTRLGFASRLVSISQTYHLWTPRRTSRRIVNKKIDAKERLTEISVTDLIGHWQ